MASQTELTEEQTYWLRRVLERRPRDGLLDTFVIPDAVHDFLIDRQLVRWHKGLVEITLEGIREIARQNRKQAKLADDDALSARAGNA